MRVGASSPVLLTTRRSSLWSWPARRTALRLSRPTFPVLFSPEAGDTPATSPRGFFGTRFAAFSAASSVRPTIAVMSGPVAVVWFRTDLRVDDNPALGQAEKLLAAKKVSSVLPCYFLDPRLFGRTRRGNPKTGVFRAKFLLECLQDLKGRLRGLGSDLLVRVGTPEKELPRILGGDGSEGGLLGKTSGSIVLTETQVTEEEKRVNA